MSRPLRVLHVMDTLGEGGAEQNLLTLVRTLRPPRCEHSVAWLYDDEDENGLLEAFRPHVRRLVPLKSGHGLAHARALRRLADVLRDDPPDLVHCKLIRAQLVGRVAALLAGRIPVVTTWECVSYRPDMYDFPGLRGLAMREVTRVLDATTGLADKQFIAVSEQVAEANAKNLGVSRKRVRVVYNAIDRSRVVSLPADRREALLRELDISGRHPILLSVGRLSSQKSHHTTIEALVSLSRRLPKIVHLIAGGGGLEAQLRRRAEELGVTEQLRLLGARSDVAQLFQLADIFVFPSLFEGLGIALMEAMAAGLPVAASRIPTTLEVARGLDTVSYFAPGDVPGLAGAVSEIAQSLDAFRRRARTAAPRVLDRFSSEALATRFMEVATQAVAGANRAAGPP